MTVVGPAGVGKTRLAVEVGRRLTAPGGVWLVRLDAVDAAAALAQVVAETLHVPGGERRLRERLAGAETVLLLDNCEHVVAQVAALVASLLDAVAAACASSPPARCRWASTDEHVHPLEPLSSQATPSRCSRAGRGEMRRQLVLDADTHGARRGGVPVPRRAAAGDRAGRRRGSGRCRCATSPAASTTGSPCCATPPASGPSGGAPCAGAIAWSYDLLFPDDQRGLWALVLLRRRAPRWTRPSTCSSPSGCRPTSVLDTITRLVDRSLVSVDGADGRRGALPAARQHPGVRRRPAARVGPGRRGRRRARRAGTPRPPRWCDEHVRGDRQPECLAIARAERANIDAALAWCAAHDPLLGCASRTGSAGPGSSSATGPRAPRGSAVPSRRGDARPRAGVRRCSSPAGSRRPPANVDRAQADLDGRARDRRGAGRRRCSRADVAAPPRLPGHPAGTAARRARVRGRQPGDLPIARPAAGRPRPACCCGAYGSLMLGDTAGRRPGRHRGAAAPDADRRLVGAGPRRGDARRHRPGRAPVRRRRRRARPARRDESAAPRLSSARPPCTWPPSPASSNEPADAEEAAASFDRAIAAATAGGDGRLARRRGSTSPGSGGPAVTIGAPAACSRRTPGGTTPPAAGRARCSTAASCPPRPATTRRWTVARRGRSRREPGGGGLRARRAGPHRRGTGRPCARTGAAGHGGVVGTGRRPPRRRPRPSRPVASRAPDGWSPRGRLSPGDPTRTGARRSSDGPPGTGV